MKKQIRNPEDFEIASKECAGVRRVSALLNRLYPAVTRFPGKCVCCGKWRFFSKRLYRVKHEKTVFYEKIPFNTLYVCALSGQLPEEGNLFTSSPVRPVPWKSATC